MSATTLDVLDSLSVTDISTTALFAGEGTRISKAINPKIAEAKTAQVMQIIRGVAEGRIAKNVLREAMTTSDFPIYFGATLNRILQAGYSEQPYSWNRYVARRTVNDFRDIKSISIEGGDGRLAEVPERTPYPEDKLVESQTSWRITKKGKRMGISFEMIINDDLDAFRSIPERLGKGARRSEEYLAAQLLADANGPHAAFWNVGNSNLITGNPALTRASLQAAWTTLSQRRDPVSGEPIAVEAVELVTGPALVQTVAEILNTTEYTVQDGAGAGQTIRRITGNGLAGTFHHSVNLYIPFVVGANAATAWWLVPTPGSGARPVLEMGFLRGHEQPETFMKAPNSQRVNGSGMDDVDFETDAKDYKVRHIFGGGRTDSVPTLASNGSGS